MLTVTNVSKFLTAVLDYIATREARHARRIQLRIDRQQKELDRTTRRRNLAQEEQYRANRATVNIQNLLK